ncbi:dual specificity protein kinase yak1 [Gurleya vavrai]
MTEFLLEPQGEKKIEDIDDENFFLKIKENEIIYRSEVEKYTVIKCLGTGSYGQVFKIKDSEDNVFALKIFKNKRSYYYHGLSEAYFLEKIKNSSDSYLFVEMIDNFVYKNHFCIRQEILGKNLYEILKITKFKGFDHTVTKKIGFQILLGLKALRKMNMVHCDIKPENILISDLENLQIKIIDFGNAYEDDNQGNFYIQSRFYRAPEVILGVYYGSGIDIWSFGCMLYELFIGYALFPGKNNEDQICRINYCLGEIPNFMLEYGVNSSKYNFNNISAENKYLAISQLKERIFRRDSNFVENEKLFDFIIFILIINPLERPTVFECLEHCYFDISESQENEILLRRESALEIERLQPNPVPEEDLNSQRKSIYEIEKLYENDAKNKRKYSVYEKENRRKS